MTRLVSKFFFLAVIAIILLITFASFFDSLPHNPYSITFDPFAPTKDDSLSGAIKQKPAQAPAPTHVVSSKIKVDPEKEKKRKEEEKRKKDELKKKEEEEKRRKKEEKIKKAKEEYRKIKIYPGTFDVPKDMVHDPEGPEPHEIVLLAASDGKGHNGGIKNILDDITPNRQEYADLHGYQYQFINISKYDIGEAHPVWAKLPAIVESFNLYPQAKWVWWLDLDAIIMTPTIDLREHILNHKVLLKKMIKGKEMTKSGGGGSGVITVKEPNMDNIDLIVSQDQNGLNAGSFFIRRSEFSKLFIDMWSDPFFIRENWIAQEQDAMMHLMKEHPTILSHVALVQQKDINAYPVVDIPGMSWEKNDLVIHFAGCWVNNVCNKQWEEHMALRVPASSVKKLAAEQVSA